MQISSFHIVHHLQSLLDPSQDDGKDDVGIRTLHFAYCEQDSAHFLVSSGVWLGFIIFVSVAITLDVTCVKPASLMELRVAAGWSLVWVGLAMGFAGFVYYSLGSRASALFITGCVCCCCART